MLSVVPRLLKARVLRLESPHLVLQNAERAQLAPILVRSFSHSTSMSRLDASWKVIMHEHWEHKRLRSSGMSNPQIDEWYDFAGSMWQSAASHLAHSLPSE